MTQKQRRTPTTSPGAIPASLCFTPRDSDPTSACHVESEESAPHALWATGSTETLKYGMPAFCYQRILVIFGAFKHHIGFYPTGAAMKPFAKDLAKFVTARGSIQFPLTRPLPLPLIRKIVALRVRHSIEQDGPWRTKKKLTRPTQGKR